MWLFSDHWTLNVLKINTSMSRDLFFHIKSMTGEQIVISLYPISASSLTAADERRRAARLWSAPDDSSIINNE